jgi:uncharacterized surface protein with fasciclin (FAS1) repeats
MNKNFGLFSFTLAMLMLGSCAEKKAETSVSPEKEKKKEEISSAESAAANGKDYAENAIAYAMNSKDLGTWTYFLNASKWQAEVKSGQYTFLCVTDESIKKNERIHLKELVRPENKKLLDNTVGLSILKGQYTPEDLLKLKEVETITGEILKIDQEARTIDGVPVTGRYVGSPDLYLLVVDDIIRYPIVELKESVGRNAKK